MNRLIVNQPHFLQLGRLPMSFVTSVVRTNTSPVQPSNLHLTVSYTSFAPCSTIIPSHMCDLWYIFHACTNDLMSINILLPPGLRHGICCRFASQAGTYSRCGLRRKNMIENNYVSHRN